MLRRNMRANPDEVEFIDWLERLGDGVLPRYRGLPADSIRLPDECVLEGRINEQTGIRNEANEEDLIDFVFPGRVDDIENINSTIVSPYILDTIDIAQRVLDRLPGEQITKTGIDDIHNRNPDDVEDIQNFPI